MSRLIVIVGRAACGRLNFEPLESLAPSDGSTDATACTTGFGPWGSVQRLDAVATPEFDLAPALHPDGLVIVFDTKIGGSRELLMTTRATKPVPVAPTSGGCRRRRLPTPCPNT